MLAGTIFDGGVTPFVLRCTHKIAATKAVLWYLVYINPSRCLEAAVAGPQNLRAKSSNTATIALPASDTLFARLLAKLDGFLTAWAETNIRNGDVRYIGI